MGKAGGSQFAGQDFTGLLRDNAIAISMDGRGAWRDKFFVERLWRSVKYEEVYPRAGACPRPMDQVRGLKAHGSSPWAEGPWIKSVG